MNPIDASDQNSKIPFLRNEFLEIFEDLFDDVIYRDNSYSRSNEELKIKLDLRLTFVEFSTVCL